MDIMEIDKKLGNEQFLAKAPKHVVDEQRRRKSEAGAALVKIAEAVKHIDEL